MIHMTRPTHLGCNGNASIRSLMHTFPKPALIGLATCLLFAGPLGYAAEPAPGGLTVEERLEQTLVDVDFDDVSLAKAVDELRGAHKLNIYVHERALDDAGIDPSTPITLKLKQVPLATGLQLLLRSASEADSRLTYTVEDEVIIISTADDTTTHAVVRTYDVSDLLDSGFVRRRLMNTPLLRLALTGRESQGAEPGGGSAMQNPFQGGGGGGMDQAALTFERLSDLIDLIKSSVSPESWLDSGGAGEIRRQGNRLVVRASPVVHGELGGMLALLRSEPPRNIDLHVCLVKISPPEAAALRDELAEEWPRLSSAEVARLEEEFAAKGAAMLRTTTTGPSGQSQMLSTLKQQDYVAELLPVVDEGVGTYQPSIAQANSGLELIVLPVLAPDGQSISLDVSFALTPRGQIGQKTFLKSEDEELIVQIRSTGMQTLVAKVRLEIGQAIMLTVPPAELSSAEPVDELFVLLRPSVE